MKHYKKKLKEWYDSAAAAYDQDSTQDESSDRSREIRRFNELLDMIRIQPHTRVLDVAAGTGTYLLEVLQHGGVGYAVDISARMLEQLTKKSRSPELKGKLHDIRPADAERLPFPEGMFDVVLCIGMCEYYPLTKVRRFLAEMRRVMKDEGRIIVDFPNQDDTRVHSFKEKERAVGHEIYIHEPETLIRFLEENGFSVLHHHEAGIERQFLLIPDSAHDT